MNIVHTLRKAHSIRKARSGSIEAARLAGTRVAAMVLVSATMYFPAQARALMRQIPTAEKQSPAEWARMRKSHVQGDEQIVKLWDWTRELQDSHDDMNFTEHALSTINARTLIVYGDRDPLYPLEMSVAMYRAIPRSALWVLPNSGHGPVFGDAAAQFVETALAFLRTVS